MKKLIFTLLTCCGILAVNAQWYSPECQGGSGPSVCNAANDTITRPGLAPISDSLQVLDLDSTVNVTIQFENYDTTGFGITTVTVDSLQIDTIGNLPGGLCWATNRASNGWGNQVKGCINVSGTVTDTDRIGQYQLYIIVNVWVAVIGELQINAAQEGLYYYVRVKCGPQDTAAHAIDTSGQAAQTNRFVPYNNVCTAGINNLPISYLNNLSIIPNPMNNEATVQLVSAKEARVVERITNVVGQEVYSNELQLNVGLNSHIVNKGRLAPGVYIYSLSDGTSVSSSRLIITE